MKFYLDTEFIECAKQRRVLGLKVGPAVPTIDLISIALVAEDGREFYALNAECELDYAWQNVWVRDNVLRPIWHENTSPGMKYGQFGEFSLSRMQAIFKAKGMTRQDLTGALVAFVYPMQYLADELNKVLMVPGVEVVGSWQGDCLRGPGVGEYYDRLEGIEWLLQLKAPFASEFYGHYCDYDWVVFCQLFGRMIDLPKGFPMYCRDLKQEQDRLGLTSDATRKLLPDPGNEHNALADARWNKQLHELLEKKSPLLANDLQRQKMLLGEIEHQLRIPVLEKYVGSVAKIRFMLAMLKRAAQGEKISNKPEDYY